MSMRILLAAAAVIATVAVAGPAKADVITNGNFATNDFTGWTLGGDTSQVQTGFTAVGQSENPSQPSGPGTGNSAYLATAGGLLTLGQSFSSTAGTRYDLTFYLLSDGGPGSVETDINSSALSTLAFSSAATDWQSYDLTFTATGASTNLQFQVSNDSSDFELTDVAANAVTVPEPSSMALLLVGVLGLVGYGVRRRSTTPSSFA